jgi:hypothetical protein
MRFYEGQIVILKSITTNELYIYVYIVGCTLHYLIGL